MQLDQMFSAIASSSSFRDSTATSLLSGGIALYQKKRYAEAVAVFKQATAYKPDLIDAYNLMANAYTQLKDNKGAINAYKISLGLDKTQGNVHMALGNIYMSDQNYAEAEKEFKETAKADPTSALPVYTLGLIYQQTGRQSEAEEMFKKTAKLSPKDGNPHYALGTLYNQQGKNREAVAELQQALQLKGNFPRANAELGKAYLALGQRDEAQQQLDILQAKDTALYLDLKDKLDGPKMIAVNTLKSTFNTDFGRETSLSLLAPQDLTFQAPNASKDFTLQFQFDRDMDPTSVMNVTNWNISKASGGTAGLYNDGLYRPNDARIPIMPKSVVYDPSKLQATITFTLSQNDTGTTTIDPSRLVFKFSGKDVQGRSMDTKADQFDSFAEIF
jgi:tetratricopeptide (TPR) repeat protein